MGCLMATSATDLDLPGSSFASKSWSIPYPVLIGNRVADLDIGGKIKQIPDFIS